MQVRDHAGNLSGGSESIVYDRLSSITGAVMRDRATGSYYYARDLTVQVQTRGAEHVHQMRLRNDGGAWSRWYTFSESRVWTLAPWPGDKEVHVQYGDVQGNVISDSDVITYFPNYGRIKAHEILDAAVDGLTVQLLTVVRNTVDYTNPTGTIILFTNTSGDNVGKMQIERLGSAIDGVDSFRAT